MGVINICLIFSFLCIILLSYILFNQLHIKNNKAVLLEKFFNNSSNYSNFTNENKNLDNILNSFSELVHSKGNDFNRISESYIETENNMKSSLKEEIESVVNNILNSINSTHKTKYKIINIERAKVEKNIFKDFRVTAVFFISETDKYSTRKILIQYRKCSSCPKTGSIETSRKDYTCSGNCEDEFNKEMNIHFNYIKAVHSTPIDKNTFSNIISKNSIVEDISYDQQFNILKKRRCGKGANKSITLQTPSEFKLQNLELDNECSIKNLPKHISTPYENPSMFTL